MTIDEAIQRVLELDEKATTAPWVDETFPYNHHSIQTANLDKEIARIKWESRGRTSGRNAELITEYRTLAPMLARELKAYRDKTRKAVD